MKIILFLAAAALLVSAAAPTQMVITVRPVLSADNRPENLEANDVTVQQGTAPAQVLQLRRLTGELADMQFFILLDDSTRSASLGTHLPELKAFLKSLPASTQVGVGYMRNGTFGQIQAFTADHEKAAHALRLPAAIPGENGSPYFALSDLAKHWPSKESTGRRAVLMLTDGVDRYYTGSIMEDPYVDASMHDALKQGIMVYSIYLRGAGFEGRAGWTTNVAQSRLIEVSQETGGYAYFQGESDPVTISPFLKDLRDRLDNQYKVTIETPAHKGVQQVKLRTEVPGFKIESPTRVYVQ